MLELSWLPRVVHRGMLPRSAWKNLNSLVEYSASVPLLYALSPSISHMSAGWEPMNVLAPLMTFRANEFPLPGSPSTSTRTGCRLHMDTRKKSHFSKT